MSKLKLSPKGELAYHKLKGKQPGLVFLHGFKSDMEGAKALALEEFCWKEGRQFIRFDFRGHGKSSGTFNDFRIGMAKEDAIAVLDNLCDGPQLLVGSSMGGWIMLLAAMARPEKIAGLIGIAAAPDFTEHLLLDAFTHAQRRDLQKKGSVMVPNCYGGDAYPISKEFIVESGEHLVLDATIPLTCPVHLIHGTMDDDVPWEFSMTLNEKLESKDVRTTLVKDGDHRLSSEKHLAVITRVVGKMLEKVGN